MCKPLLSFVTVLAVLFAVGCDFDPVPPTVATEDSTPVVTTPTVAAPPPEKPQKAEPPPAPVAEPEPEPEPEPVRPVFMELTLPSGEVLRREEVMPTADKIKQMFGGPKTFFVNGDAAGNVFGAYTEQDRQFDGPCATYYLSSEQPMAIYGHSRMRRHGPMWMWDETGDLVYWTTYAAGRKQGLACLLREGEPWYVQSFRSDVLHGEWLVEVEGNEFVARPVGVSAVSVGDDGSEGTAVSSSGEGSEAASLAAATLAALDAALVEAERRDKQAFTRRNREQDDFERKRNLNRSASQRAESIIEETRRNKERLAAHERLVQRFRGLIWRWVP